MCHITWWRNYGYGDLYFSEGYFLSDLHGMLSSQENLLDHLCLMGSRKLISVEMHHLSSEKLYS